MRTLRFCKLVPGGNPTLLLPDPLDLTRDELASASAVLLSPDHIQAEQAGALYADAALEHRPFPGEKPGLPHLEMMGGEFCVNAARCAAALLARQGYFSALHNGHPRSGAPADSPAVLPSAAETSQCVRPVLPFPAEAPRPEVWAGRMTVSGADEPVFALVATAEHVLLHFLETATPATVPSVCPGQKTPAPVSAFPALTYAAVRVCCSSSTMTYEEKEPGVVLLAMPGIVHLLLDTELHALPDTRTDAWRRTASMWRKKYCLQDVEASGVIWHRREEKGSRIWPAVAVRATGTEYLETACGSGSLALAFWRSRAEARSNTVGGYGLSVIQPSGECLQITFLPHAATQSAGQCSFPAGKNSPEPDHVWISGPVRLVAEGTAYY